MKGFFDPSCMSWCFRDILRYLSHVYQAKTQTDQHQHFKFRTSCAPDYYITEQPEQLQYFPILQHCIGQFEFNLFRDEPLDRQDRRLSLQWLASVKINNQSPYDLWWSVKFPDWVLAQSWDLSRYLSTEGTYTGLYTGHTARHSRPTEIPLQPLLALPSASDLEVRPCGRHDGGVCVYPWLYITMWDLVLVLPSQTVHSYHPNPSTGSPQLSTTTICNLQKNICKRYLWCYGVILWVVVSGWAERIVSVLMCWVQTGQVSEGGRRVGGTCLTPSSPLLSSNITELSFTLPAGQDRCDTTATTSTGSREASL